MADNSNVLTGNDWKWDDTPPLDPSENEDRAASIYGNHFPEGIRYRGKVTGLRKVKTEDGKTRVELEAVCLGGDGEAAKYAGKTLKSAFFFPLPSELVGLDRQSKEFKSKTFSPRLFNAFVVATGHAARTGDDQTPLDKMVGDVFDFTAKDRTIAGREKKNIRGEMIKYPDTLTSSLQQVFKPESSVSADNEPLPEAPASSKAVSNDFGGF